MFRAIALALVMSLLVACSESKAPAPGMNERYVSHTVQYPGETLGVISSWYTGSAANWNAIKEANPTISVKSIKIGDTIQIPERLVTRRDPLTREFVTGKKVLMADQNAMPTQNEARENPSANEMPQHMEVANSGNDSVVPTSNNGGQGDDINAELYQAVLFGDAGKVSTLLAKGADVNHLETNRPLIGWAAQNGNTDVIAALLAGGAKLNILDGVGHSPLMRAVDTNQSAAADALIKAGADLNMQTPDGKTALYIAASNGSTEMTKLLLDAGANANIAANDGMYPALLAIQYGYNELVPLYVAAKANLNINTHIIYTPLLLAIEQGSKELVEELLRGGADPNVKSKSGRAPLLAALDTPELFGLLLQYKADPNIKNDLGKTALMVAVENDSVDRARELIKAGADLNVKDEGGRSALTLAQDMSRTELVDLLKSSGATE